MIHPVIQFSIDIHQLLTFIKYVYILIYMEIYKSEHINYSEVPYCACLNSRKLARTITSYYDKMIKPAGINGTQFTLLSAVNFMQPVTINDLAERLGMDRTTLSRNVNLLEKDGFCESGPGQHDKRQREIRLTQKGKETLERAYPLWKQAQQHFYRFFDKKEWKDTVAHFNEIIKDF